MPKTLLLLPMAAAVKPLCHPQQQIVKTCNCRHRRRFEKQACEVLRQANVRRRQAAAAKTCCMCIRRRRVSAQVSISLEGDMRMRRIARRKESSSWLAP